MQFKLQLTMNGEAFEESRMAEIELENVLKNVGRRIKDGRYIQNYRNNNHNYDCGTIRDLNGNTVGEWTIDSDDE